MKAYFLILGLLAFKSTLLFSAVNEKDFLSKLKKQDFYPHYKTYIEKALAKKKEKYDEKKWVYHEIESSEAVTKAARPGREFYNDVILWYGEGEERLGLRPIDTPTDCSSGCSPVVFHLAIDAQGKTVDLLEAGEPLLKKFHVPFSANDKKKVLSLAQKLPEVLTLVNHPLELTENTSKQTWTVYEDTLVKDGAYTSFIVQNVARLTKDYVGPKTKKSEDLKAAEKRLTELFKAKIDSEKSLLDMMGKMKEFALETKILLIKKVLLDNLLKAHFYLIAQYSETLERAKMKEFVKAHFTPFEKEYSGFLQNGFVNLLNNFLKSQKGREFLLVLEEDFKGWQHLPRDLRLHLSFLAQGLSENIAYLKKKAPQIEAQALLEYSSQNSFLLKAFIKSFITLGQKEISLKAYSRFTVRFPKASRDDLPSLPIEWSKDLESYENKEIHNYAKYLSREFQNLEKQLPQITGIKPYDKDVKKTIPDNKDAKQIFIFFGNWCGHCLEMLTELGKTMPRSFWEKTQLISVLSDDRSMLEKFLAYGKLKETIPHAISELVMLDDSSPESKAFYDKLNLLAVPKIVLTDKKGNIVDFSFHLDPHPEKDLDRDIKLILSTID